MNVYIGSALIGGRGNHMPVYKVGIFSSNFPLSLNKEGSQHIFESLSYFHITGFHCPLFWTIAKKNVNGIK